MSSFTRKGLADIAEREAKLKLVWAPGSEADKYKKKFQGPPAGFGKGKWSWCAAFVTWCAEQCGLIMPVKCPNSKFGYTFALVEAWQQWAIQNGYYHDNDGVFVPERGDISCFDWSQSSINQKDTDWENHIGVHLYMSGRNYVCAEGNTSNMTNIKTRTPIQIQGWIRLPDGFSFGLDSKPVPAPVPNPADGVGNSPGPARVLRKGLKGPDVYDLQFNLVKRGYAVGTLDSAFGPKVESAVKQFQADNGLVPDGVVGAKTYAKLGAKLPTVGDRPAPKFTKLSEIVANLEEGTAGFHQACYMILEFDSGTAAKVEAAARRVLAGKVDMYAPLERARGIPWAMTAVIHAMECNNDPKGVLHNGQRIVGTNKKTTIVPIGRGPFKTWMDAALDAVDSQSLWKVPNWSIGYILKQCERFNGTGYITGAGRSEITPYLYSCTNINDGAGKYTSDGRFDPKAPSNGQVGIAAILRQLEIWGEFKPTYL